MIQKHLTFTNGSKGLFLKQGVSGEMLYGKQTVAKYGDVSSNISRNKQKMVEEHLNNGLNFTETAAKMRLGRNAIGYYVKKIVEAKGEEGPKWEQDIRDRTAKNKHLKQIQNAKPAEPRINKDSIASKIFDLHLSGLTNKEISENMDISTSKVSIALYKRRELLGVQNPKNKKKLTSTIK